jgi:rod shape-determining protein MreC
MYIIRRWWERYALTLVLVSLSFGTAWAIRHTQGAVVVEVYQVLTRPFQSSSNQGTYLYDARVQELETRIVELENKNQQLEELLGYVNQINNNASPQQAIAAPVIGRSADQWWQQITLGRGTQAGIQVGDIVTAPGGLVGRVTSVSFHTSRVLLISDPTSQLGVTISRSRFMGFLRGQSANYAVMQFFDKVPDVRPGDAIATSPYSQIFPAGIPVGVVESIDLTKSPAPEAIIALSAPMPHLEWVVVSAK